MKDQPISGKMSITKVWLTYWGKTGQLWLHARMALIGWRVVNPEIWRGHQTSQVSLRHIPVNKGNSSQDVIYYPWLKLWIYFIWHGSMAGSKRHLCIMILTTKSTLIARFMGPTWGPSGADRTQVGPMLVPWTLLSGKLTYCNVRCEYHHHWTCRWPDTDRSWAIIRGTGLTA